MSAIDHLAVAAGSLDRDAAAVERALGVPLQPGGQHVRMGTRNRLLRLRGDAYLELIAIDPEAARPERPRWFELDRPEMEARLADGPRLVHWVARVDSTELPPLPFDVGPWEQFQRGDLSWQLTVRADGTLPGNGVVPSLICWNGTAHPARRLPDAGVSLVGLELEHPRATAVQRQLDVLGLPVRCKASPTPRIVVRLQTPAGPRTFRSSEPLR